MTWQDEFNDPAGTRRSSSRWVYELGGEPQWGNQEWQYHTDRAESLSTDGSGNLAIADRCPSEAERRARLLSARLR